MVAGDKTRVLEAARGDKDPELRKSAVHLLGVMGARTEMWELYQAETTAEAKEALLQAMFVGGDAQHLIEVVRGDKDEAMRRAAVRNLGLLSRDRTGDVLGGVYKSDPVLRGAVIDAFFLQQNVAALIAIAREEKDPGLRRDAVQKLSLMKSKEATAFLLEILEK